MTLLYHVDENLGDEPTRYVQSPPTVESLRAKLAELRRVFELAPDPNVAALLRERCEQLRNHLAALNLQSDRSVWEKYVQVVNDVNNGVHPRGVLTREDADSLLGL